MRLNNRMVFEAVGGAGAAPPPAAAPAGSSPGPGAAPGAGAAAAAAPAPAPAPAPASFADQLPADIRELPVFRDIKDLSGLAKSYAHASKMLGNRDPNTLFQIPAADDQAGIEALYTKLGRPEKPDGYKLSKPAEGVTVDAKLQSGFMEQAHKAGLSDRQADALYQWWNNEAAGVMRTATEARNAEIATNEAALKSEWGAAYDQNMGLAKQALQHYGSPDLVAELEKTGLGNAPNVIKTFAKLGLQLQEDGVVGRGTSAAAIKAPTEARREIAALQADKAFMAQYTNKRDPGHAAATARMQGLYEMAYPAQQ